MLAPAIHTLFPKKVPLTDLADRFAGTFSQQAVLADWQAAADSNPARAARRALVAEETEFHEPTEAGSMVEFCDFWTFRKWWAVQGLNLRPHACEIFSVQFQ